MADNIGPITDLPDWVPPAVRLYLAHTEEGLSLREIARAQGVHASTVLRQVRRFESRRDDPLIDRVLGRLRPGTGDRVPREGGAELDSRPPTAPATADLPADEARLLAEARRLLPLLARPDTVLVVAADLDRGVILQEAPEGAAQGGQRLAVLDRPLAEAFALRDWIACRKRGRVAQYVLAPDGRALLRRLGPELARSTPAPLPADEGGEPRFRPPPESPVAVLARRRDRDGAPFLSPRQVQAAERLREDFEIARLGPRAGPDWQRLLTGRIDRSPGPGPLPGATPAAAQGRVLAALHELGPGLGDVALRCCCWQEGIETAEQKLGWSARSGKVVLRIALDRLARHYEAQGEAGKLIG